MENTPISVTEAIALVNQTFDYAFPTLVVEGELASFKVNQGKWVFFDLKDSEGTLSCFMTLFQLRTQLEDGMRVQVVATPKLTNWGKFSLTVREVRPIGEGSLKRAATLLHAKLENEGLFASERKRQLPEFPAKIAVISSTQAAGYADFIRILNERWGGIRVEVAHVQVQGAHAPDQMIRALKYFNEQLELPDVIALIRGGGSADDLSAFNDELLVREIAASRVPTIVGVGHEVDETLTDLAADVRAATPSHAAQILVPDRQDSMDAVRREVVYVANRTRVAIEDISRDVRQLVNESRAIADARLERSIESAVTLRQLLKAHDPTAVLARGYAIVRGDIQSGSVVEIEQAKQLITAEVQHVRQK